MAIRFFSADLENDAQFGFDFFNTAKKEAVNSPDGWVVNVIPELGSLTLLCAGPLKSWEAAWGYSGDDIPPGEERFSTIEGAMCQLDRPGKESFLFEVPKRPRRVPPGVKFAIARPL